MPHTALNLHAITRFSDRVTDYARYRPSYPAALAKALANELGLSSASVVADVGSGTGISSALLLSLGCTVFGVEPNTDMRRAAESTLKGHPRFRSIAGTAEATTLADRSVNVVTAGQAFHWFDLERTRREWLRILAPTGRAALFWNTRRTEANPFVRDYNRFLETHGTDYLEVERNRVKPETLLDFFGQPYTTSVFDNAQTIDLDDLKGRVRSPSYTPAIGKAGHEQLMREVERVFAAHQIDGQVRLDYDTELYVGSLRP